MRKVVQGKRYDTETAELVADYSYGYGNDFRHFEEELYKTKNGNWFKVGSGGPMSQYCESANGNTWGISDVFIPMSDEEAFNWLQTHDIDADIIEKHFADTIQDA